MTNYNQTIPITELPTLKMNIRQLMQIGDRQIGKLFYLLAAAQILTVIAGAIVALLVAPASLFAAHAEAEAFAWIVVGLTAAFFAALGAIVAALALIAAFGIKGWKRYGRICGIIAATLTVLQFPLGTAFGVYLLARLRKH